jgi:hypothetical protein
MPELSRTQVAVYGAIAVALLFIGARAVRGEGGGGSGTSTYADYSSESGTEDEAGLTVAEGGSDVVVDVTGAVRKPGVYRCPPAAA